MNRLFHLVVSLIALILLVLPIVIIALVILLTMSPPVIFKQKRPGVHGMPFSLDNVGTMTNEVNKEGIRLPNSERMTKTGNLLRKLSLDELPQLFNVLKGELSLVGPRPLLMDYLTLYASEQARRQDVKPGITGWAQVNGRNAISWEERFILDVWYVDNQTLFLDMKILFLTIAKVVRSDGVNKSEGVTMEKFKGTGTDD